MLKLACARWLWFVGDHFFFLFSKFYLLDDSISQSPGRKQMVHSNWAFWRYFIKGIFFKSRQSSITGTHEEAVFRSGENGVPLHSHLKGPEEGGSTEPERALWTGQLAGAVVHGSHWAERWGGKPWPHSPPFPGSLAGTLHRPNPTRSQSSGDPTEWSMWISRIGTEQGGEGRGEGRGEVWWANCQCVAQWGYATFITAGRVINKKQKPFAALSVFTHAHTSCCPTSSMIPDSSLPLCPLGSHST